MQPARDATDPRFIPARLGGHGGFSYYRKAGIRAPYAYTAIIPKAEQPALSIDAELAKAYTPDALRARARAVLALAMERVESTLSDTANELKLNELAPTMAALGRISGVQLEEQKTGDIRIHIVRDALPMPDHATPRALHEVSPSKDMGHNEITNIASPDASGHAVLASPHALGEVEEAKDMGAQDLGDATSRDT